MDAIAAAVLTVWVEEEGVELHVGDRVVWRGTLAEWSLAIAQPKKLIQFPLPSPPPLPKAA